MNALAIFEKAKHGGKVTGAELKFLRDELGAPTKQTDVHNTARAFSLLNAPTEENVQLIQKHFTGETDDWDLQGIILSLCRDWDLQDRYLNELIFYTDAENQVTFSAAAIAAFSCLATYLHITQDSKIYALLIKRYDEQLNMKNSLDPQFNKTYFRSICETIGSGILGLRAVYRMSLNELQSDKIIFGARKKIN